MNRADMSRLGISEGESVTASACAGDAERKVRGLRAVGYDIPEGCAAGYYPECNPLVPVWHHAERSDVPAAKHVAIRVTPEGQSDVIAR